MLDWMLEEDDDLIAAEALGIWQNGTNDQVWEAVFERGVDMAAELLDRIEGTPDFTVGDLTHDQVVATILRRYPILDRR